MIEHVISIDKADGEIENKLPPCLSMLSMVGALPWNKRETFNETYLESQESILLVNEIKSKSS